MSKFRLLHHGFSFELLLLGHRGYWCVAFAPVPTPWVRRCPDMHIRILNMPYICDARRSILSCRTPYISSEAKPDCFQVVFKPLLEVVPVDPVGRKRCFKGGQLFFFRKLYVQLRGPDLDVKELSELLAA